MDLLEKLDSKIEKELVFLSKFIDIFCSHKHQGVPKDKFSFNKLDDELWNGINLCKDCAKLFSHGIVMRIKCPMDPRVRAMSPEYLSYGLTKKPMCKKCPDKCYNEYYEKQIVEVMKFSGMKMILGGRVDLIYHYFF